MNRILNVLIHVFALSGYGPRHSSKGIDFSFRSRKSSRNRTFKYLVLFGRPKFPRTSRCKQIRAEAASEEERTTMSLPIRADLRRMLTRACSF